MVHGVQPVLPFDIVEVTYLIPALDTRISTEELIATRVKLLLKRDEDIATFQSDVLKTRLHALCCFEETFARTMANFDSEPGRLVLLRNSRIEESLNRKTKPRYIGPYVVVKCTKGGSYILAELDGSIFRIHAAAFHIVPYQSRSHSRVPVTRLVDVSVDDLDDLMMDDPSDQGFDSPSSLMTDRED
jgi:hypothetical protein